MDAQCDTTLIELISSRICHDLTSPVGAIANGMEIMEEMGADSDVTSLISFSTAQASAKLKTLRLAYGLGGSDEGIKNETIHETFGDFIAGDNRITQSWNPYSDIDLVPKKGFPKIFMCCLITMCDALPRGGEISVKTDSQVDNMLLITANGDRASAPSSMKEALSNNTPVSQLDPKHAHYYVTGLFANKYGFEITVSTESDNFISLRLKQADVSC